MNTNKIKQIFQAMAKTITESDDFISDRHGRPRQAFESYFFVRDNMLLRGAAAEAYMNALNDIAALAEEEATWSRSSVDDVIAQCLNDVAEAKPDEREAAIQKQAAEIMQRFKTSPSSWSVDLLVNGMQADCAGLSFGKFSFILEPVDVPQYVKAQFQALQTAQILARTEAVAIDDLSAIHRARNLFDDHVLILNALCAERLPSTFRVSHTSYLGPTYSVHRVAPAGKPTSETRFQGTHTRMPLSRGYLQAALQRRGGEQISEMLSSPRNEFSERVLSACGLAGAACVDPHPERSFLFFTIALESVVLGRETNSELTYHLAPGSHTSLGRASTAEST